MARVPSIDPATASPDVADTLGRLPRLALRIDPDPLPGPRLSG